METPRMDGPTRDKQGRAHRVHPCELDGLPIVLTVQEAATVLRVGRNQAYEMVRRGEIAAVRCGSSWRVPRSALIQFLASDA